MNMLLALYLFGLGPSATPTAKFSPTGHWLQYVSLEDAGFSSQALEEARAMAEAGKTAAFLAVYRGHVLTAWGEVEMRAIPLAGRLPALPDREAISLSVETLAAYAGRYDLGQDLVGSIRALEDRLVLRHPHMGEIDIFPTSRTDFFVWNSNIQVQFSFDDQGRPQGAMVDLYGRKIICTRIE